MMPRQRLEKGVTGEDSLAFGTGRVVGSTEAAKDVVARFGVIDVRSTGASAE
jgi:hypothetical protein